MKILINLFFCTVLLFAIAAAPDRQDKCDLFNSSRSSDTLVLEASRGSLVMLPKGSPTLKYLDQRKLLVAAQVSATIFLKFDGCQKEMDFPLLDNSDEAKEILSKGLGERVEVTLVALRDSNIPYYKDRPFVMVTKLRGAKKK